MTLANVQPSLASHRYTPLLLSGTLDVRQQCWILEGNACFVNVDPYPGSHTCTSKALTSGPRADHDDAYATSMLQEVLHPPWLPPWQVVARAFEPA